MYLVDEEIVAIAREFGRILGLRTRVGIPEDKERCGEYRKEEGGPCGAERAGRAAVAVVT